MSSVRIPPTLRTATGGAKRVDVAGTTVGEVIEALATTYPSLRTQLLTAEGALNRFVNVYLNDTDVRHLDGPSTPVTDGDEVVLLPAMAGGAGCCQSETSGRCRCPGASAGQNTAG